MKYPVLLCLLFARLSFSADSLSDSTSLTGTWCFEEEGMILTFMHNDSVMVSSIAEEGISGRGTFTREDTMFVAVITNQDLTIRMGYRYAWMSDSTIEARTLFLTVNGDSVNHPTDPIPMKRCAEPEKEDSSHE